MFGKLLFLVFIGLVVAHNSTIYIPFDVDNDETVTVAQGPGIVINHFKCSMSDLRASQKPEESCQQTFNCSQFLNEHLVIVDLSQVRLFLSNLVDYFVTSLWLASLFVVVRRLLHRYGIY